MTQTGPYNPTIASLERAIAAQGWDHDGTFQDPINDPSGKLRETCVRRWSRGNERMDIGAQTVRLYVVDENGAVKEERGTHGLASWCATVLGDRARYRRRIC